MEQVDYFLMQPVRSSSVTHLAEVGAKGVICGSEAFPMRTIGITPPSSATCPACKRAAGVQTAP